MAYHLLCTGLQDYVNISNMYLNFSFGVQRRNVTVTILDDDMFEADEEFYVMMSVMNTSDANIIIDDNDNDNRQTNRLLYPLRMHTGVMRNCL